MHILSSSSVNSVNFTGYRFQSLLSNECYKTDIYGKTSLMHVVKHNPQLLNSNTPFYTTLLDQVTHLDDNGNDAL